MPRKVTTEAFVERARAKHSGKYSYAKTEYVNSRTKVIITCELHGDFEQQPNNHLTGNGCPSCGGSKPLSEAQFLDRAKTKYGSKFDYSQMVFMGVDYPITVTCPDHGQFEQTAYTHLKSKYGCPDCALIGRAKTQALDRASFVYAARLVHGDRYDYSKSDYKSAHVKLEIICRAHGVFSQTYANHVHGGTGCPKCGDEASADKKSMTFDLFVERATKIHGSRYFYAEEGYQKQSLMVPIICREPNHGIFYQNKFVHLRGNGCPKCSKRHRRSQQEFIDDAKKKHNSFYDYNESHFTRTNEKISIRCPKHGPFTQLPSAHLRGAGCPSCAPNRKMTTKLFIKLAESVHGRQYTYDKARYKTPRGKVLITCKTHGDFNQSASDHLSGYGCQVCGREKVEEARRFSRAEVLEKFKLAHGDQYNYDHFDYQGSHVNAKIQCAVHGVFLQQPILHWQGTGCPRCVNKREGEIAVILNNVSVAHREYKIKNRRFDYFLPELGLIIERDGEQHYPHIWERESIFSKSGRTYEETHAVDVEKTNLAAEAGYLVRRIPYWLSQQDVVTEVGNILAGNSSYPPIPDPLQEKTKPRPSNDH